MNGPNGISDLREPRRVMQQAGGVHAAEHEAGQHAQPPRRGPEPAEVQAEHAGQLHVTPADRTRRE